MPKLNELRNQLLISHFQGVINDEEFLLLSHINKSKNLDLPYESYDYFDFDMLENDECLSEFRFRKQNIPLLADVLQVPDVITCYQRSVCSGLEARPLYCPQETSISLSVCRYDTQICEARSSTMYDQQLHG